MIIKIPIFARFFVSIVFLYALCPATNGLRNSDVGSRTKTHGRSKTPRIKSDSEIVIKANQANHEMRLSESDHEVEKYTICGQEELQYPQVLATGPFPRRSLKPTAVVMPSQKVDPMDPNHPEMRTCIDRKNAHTLNLLPEHSYWKLTTWKDHDSEVYMRRNLASVSLN